MEGACITLSAAGTEPRAKAGLACSLGRGAAKHVCGILSYTMHQRLSAHSDLGRCL